MSAATERPGSTQSSSARAPPRDLRADRGGVVLHVEAGEEVVAVRLQGALAVGDGEAAAQVERRDGHAQLALDVVEQVERDAERAQVRLGGGDLRADVQVQPGEVEVRRGGGEAERLHRLADVDPGLAAAGGLEAGVRAAGDVDVHARQHARRAAEVARDLVDAAQLAERVGDGAADAGRDRLLQLAPALGDAVEHGLPRREPGAQRLPELAARVHLDARAGGADLLEEPEVGAGLAGEEHVTRGVPRLERPPQAGDVRGDPRLRVEEERGVDPAGQAGDVDPVEEQPAALHRHRVRHPGHPPPPCRRCPPA